MRLNKLLLFLLTAFPFGLQAQYEGIDKDYFEFPIQPDKTNFLSGNMGELRSSHFHAGLDIKTAGKEGLNVFAAAEGYVSRVRVATGGYGNCIYIQHPNGTTTVYAHLQRFNPIIAEYVLKNQYKRESFTINLFPKRNEFVVKQGEIIGLSGNSGSSTGPHLHFEIRGLNQEVLDPLRIGNFSQIEDNIPPAVQRVALKAMDMNSRVNGQFGRFEFPLTREGSTYIIPDTLDVFGKIGIEVYTYDQHNGASNKNGVPLIDMTVDDQLYFSQNIDTINFAKQKNILIHTNYQAQKESRRRFNKLYVDEGNTLDFYDAKVNDGFVYASPGQTKRVSMQLQDAFGNTSKVEMTLRGVEKVSAIDSEIRASRGSYVQDNALVLFQPKDSTNNNITLYNQKGSFIAEPTYTSDKSNVYLIDLRRFLPQSVTYNDGTKESLHFADRVPAANAHSYLSDTYSLRFSKNALFDTVYIRARHFIDDAQMEVFEVDQDRYPLKGSVYAEFMPLAKYDDIEKYHVYSIDNPRNPGFVGGKYEEDKFSFNFSSFGKFTLLKDDVAPTIKKRSVKDGRISLTIRDNLSGINSFEAKLNGEWILMKYEPKRSLIWSERLDKNKPLVGEFELKVADNAGNESFLKLKLD
ncbi:M23 family metallopeptidase [Roseivirga sp. E12]|uniref:M23 family metallopeptidase n=1 Tax=Roseivirga sp. E12 TaxID=2819237 RepID=UPI001ABD25F2|nr:M23 family metallopeptidase [Roseivirga sp. E12]MBO3696871.1 M23 family metallopeptidase [Roseivirga sp. E12]